MDCRDRWGMGIKFIESCRNVVRYASWIVTLVVRPNTHKTLSPCHTALVPRARRIWRARLSRQAVGPKVPGWVIRRRVHVPPTEPYWANDEFTPLPPKEATMAQPEAVVSYPTFHQCVDEFYTLLEDSAPARLASGCMRNMCMCVLAVSTLCWPITIPVFCSSRRPRWLKFGRCRAKFGRIQTQFEA